MTIEDFEHLVQSSGLNLLSKGTPHFLVSLRVPTQYGTRVQCGKLSFSSQEAFLSALPDEVAQSVEELRGRLVRASQTQQGDVARGGTIEVVTKQVAKQTALNYPAH